MHTTTKNMGQRGMGFGKVEKILRNCQVGMSEIEAFGGNDRQMKEDK